MATLLPLLEREGRRHSLVTAGKATCAELRISGSAPRHGRPHRFQQHAATPRKWMAHQTRPNPLA